MHLSPRVLLPIIGLVALAGLGWFSWATLRMDADSTIGSQQQTQRADTSRPPSNQDRALGLASLPTVPSTRSPSTSGQSARERERFDWVSVYASRDPYPTVVALWEARRKGTFAASWEIQRTCLDALIAISRQPNHRAPDAAAPDEHLGARLRAKQEIEVRCSRFSGQDTLALSQPAAGDAFGDRIRHALSTLSEPADAKSEAEALAELFDQGLAATQTSLRLITKSRTWRGESWQDRATEFDTAAFVAVRLATSTAAAGVADLRDLVACYRGGACAEFFADQLRHVAPGRRQAVESLARDMATSLKAGDLAPWRQKVPASAGG